MERHTLQDRVHPVYRGTRRPIPEKFRPEPTEAYAYRRDHDYTYGLSKPSLRPEVNDDEPIKGWSGPPVQPAPKPKPRPKKRKRRSQSIPVQPWIEVITVDDDGVTMPDDSDTPWWLDEEVLVSRNEDMLADLLAESQ